MYLFYSEIQKVWNLCTRIKCIGNRKFRNKISSTPLSLVDFVFEKESEKKINFLRKLEFISCLLSKEI